MTYRIDFSGSCKIEAINSAEAASKFWEAICNDEPLPLNIYSIEKINQEKESR